MPPHDCCSQKPQHINKTILTIVVILLILLLSYFLPILVPFRNSFLMYFQKVWLAMLIGLLIGGIVEYFIPREYISHVLARKKKRTILYSVGLGFLMSVCSHGILAISMELYKKGASTSAVITFLLASPWANVPITLILFSFFGLAKTLYIILMAIVIALTTGWIFQILELKGWVEKNHHSMSLDNSFTIKDDIARRARNYKLSVVQILKDVEGILKGSWALANMVLWWILAGMAVASLAGAYIPPHIFNQYMGPTIAGMLITLAVATVIEVCSEGTAPLAFEIYHQTGAVGNSFVFLMAGVVTDYTEIGLVWQNIGRKTALWMPIITVPQVLFWGMIANVIFR